MQAAAGEHQLQGASAAQAADRPSEWSGFVYNPYSGDLLPPEGRAEEQVGGESGGEGPDAYSARRCACLAHAVMVLAPLSDPLGVMKKACCTALKNKGEAYLLPTSRSCGHRW